MKLILFFCSILYCTFTLALNSNDVNQNLHDIKNKINQVNNDINSKQQQQQSISKALNASVVALNQSELVLKQIKQQRDLTQQQLHKIEQSMSEINQSIITLKTSLQKTINQIYIQIQIQNNSEQSILNSNNTVNASRKKIYLEAILKNKLTSLQLLQTQTSTLQANNDKLQQQIDILNKKLGLTTQQKSQIITAKQKQIQQAEILKSQIKQENNKLVSLKERQTKLNSLMNQIIAAEVKTRQQALAKKRNNNQKKTVTYTFDQNTQNNVLSDKSGYSDDSPFFSRKTVKPLNTNIALGFGAMRDNVANKGILFDYVERTPVHAIADGKVMYTGDLPGFGKVIIIDHGNDYMSIYSGVIPLIKTGTKVSIGQTIANTGDKENQPLGGMYFELRHLGKPVNPSKILS